MSHWCCCNAVMLQYTLSTSWCIFICWKFVNCFIIMPKSKCKKGTFQCVWAHTKIPVRKNVPRIKIRNEKPEQNVQRGQRKVRFDAIWVQNFLLFCLPFASLPPRSPLPSQVLAGKTWWTTCSRRAPTCTRGTTAAWSRFTTPARLVTPRWGFIRLFQHISGGKTLDFVLTALGAVTFSRLEVSPLVNSLASAAQKRF